VASRPSVTPTCKFNYDQLHYQNLYCWTDTIIKGWFFFRSLLSPFNAFIATVRRVKEGRLSYKKCCRKAWNDGGRRKILRGWHVWDFRGTSLPLRNLQVLA
jgi:hypothetical protein